MAKDNYTDKSQPEIRKYYKPTGKEEEMLKRVYRRKQQMEEGSDYLRASVNWDKWRKQWEAERQAPDEEWQSNHIVPFTPAVVESALAEMVDQSPQNFIMGRSNEDKPKATVMRNIFQYTWEISHSDSALYDILKDTLICGTGIGQEYYLKAPRKIRYYVKEAGKLKEVEKKVFDYDDCCLEPVKLEDFRVDENARYFNPGPYTARDCMRRFIQDADDVKAYFSQPGWNELARNLEYIKPGGDLNYYEFYKPPQGIDRKRQVEVWWYWSKLPDDWLVVVANDVVIYMGPNIHRHKQLPFVRAIDIKRTHSFYHKGEPEVLESVQDEKNTIRRMILDRNHLDIDKMFAVSSSLQLTEDDLIARPHALFPVTNPQEDIRPIEYNDTPRSIEYSLTKLDEDGILATGIDPRLTSLPEGATATQAAIAKEVALKRIRAKLKSLENDFLVDMGRLRIANIMQYYSQPKLEKILGEKGTARYEAEIARLQAQGLLIEKDGQYYKEKYRDIRIENKELVPKADGTFEEKPIKGYTFFEARPEYFIPLSEQGFDIKIKAGSTLAISESLQQTKAAEMYDRLMPLAVKGVGYDPVKLGDLLLEVNHYEPDEFHIDKEPSGGETDQRAAKAIQLAMDENNQMLNGNIIPPTPYAPPFHTRVHIEFLRSSKVPKDLKILQLFSDHVFGEIIAQQQRTSGAGGEVQQAEGENQLMQMMAGITPSGQASSTAAQSGESLRRAVSTKAPKTKLSMQDLLPGKIDGINSMPVNI